MDHVDILYICACDMVLYKCMNRKFKKDVYVCVWCVCVCEGGNSITRGHVFLNRNNLHLFFFSLMLG